MTTRTKQGYGFSSSSSSQPLLYLKIAAGIIQIAIITIMILDGIEVREINRFKYYAGEPWTLPETKDYYLNRRLIDANAKLGLLIAIIVLVCLKQPLFWFGVVSNQAIALLSSGIMDLICFVIYVIILAAYTSKERTKETFTAEAAVGLVFSLISFAVTGLLGFRIRQENEYD